MDKKNNIGKYQKVSKFLDRYEGSTKAGFKSGIKNFFDFLKENPDEYIKDVRLMENGEKLATMDKYEDDMERYWKSLKGRPVKTINSYMAMVRVFFKANRIDIADIFWKDLKRLQIRNQAVTEETPITSELFEDILQYADLKAKALFLLTASSGMRIGEVLQITLEDISFNNPTKITIRPEITKNGTKRITYISDEATRHLKSWLKERDAYLEIACKKTNIVSYHGIITKSMDDNRVFPFSDDVARDIWNRLVKKAGVNELDKNTYRHKCHIHGLRKFFRTNFVKSGFPNAIGYAEKFMGHNGYLAETYFNPTEDEMVKAYKESEKFLCVYDRPVENKEIVEKMQNEVKSLKGQIAEMQKYYEILMKNPNLRRDIHLDPAEQKEMQEQGLL